LSERRSGAGWQKENTSTPLLTQAVLADHDRQARRSYALAVKGMSEQVGGTSAGCKANPEELPDPRRQVEGCNIAGHAEPDELVEGPSVPRGRSEGGAGGGAWGGRRGYSGEGSS